MTPTKCPLVSIIIPVYNTNDYLRACLESIECQTYSEIEVILVNDGSTDNSGEICREYCEKDSRFKLIEQSNSGLSAARNTGLDFATGEYITFVDSDDVVNSKFLYTLINAMESGISIVQCAYTKFDENIPSQDNVSQRTTEIKTNCLRDYILSNGLTTVVWDKMYRRDVFDAESETIRFPIGKTMEDAYILTDIYASVKPTVKVIDDILYYYRVRMDSIMTRKFSTHFMECSFEQYRHRIELTREYPELYMTSCRQLASDFFHYYQLIYNGKVVDENGEKNGCYEVLSRWQKESWSLIPKGKTRVLLSVLNLMPKLIKFCG